MTIESKKYPTDALIDGVWVGAEKTFAVIDPATGEEIRRCDIRRAISLNLLEGDLGNAIANRYFHLGLLKNV